VVLYLVAPIFPSFVRQVKDVISATHAVHPFFQTYWSHAVFGGPVGRWSTMLTIGYWQRLTGKVPTGGRQVGLVESPNGVLAMLVGGGICFATICAVGTQRLLRDKALAKRE
jgi:uncharacterized membrane protein